MKREQFIYILKNKLKEHKVIDIEEIIEEYNDHFDYKLEDGFSEEEVSVKLGDPLYLADQYIEDSELIVKNKKVWPIIGVISLDLFTVQGYILFAAWVLVLFVFASALLAIGVSLFAAVSPFGWIPYLPYRCGAVLGISMLSLSVFSFVGTFYSYLYLKQITKKYIRFHKNVFAKAKNKPTLPSLPGHVVQSKKSSRLLRTLFQLSLNAFAISFVLGFLVCAISAKSFEFWHVFEWFV